MLLVATSVSLALLLCSSSAFGFTILTFASEACHEKITLGALGIGESAFATQPSNRVQGLYEEYLEDIRRRGVPDDKATRAFVRDVVQLYDLDSRPLEEQYLLASFICGVRLPDTAGLNVVSINDARFTHLDDANQSIHSLRHGNHEDVSGNTEAIERARGSIVGDLSKAHAAATSEDGPFRTSRWTFDFADSQAIQVYGPALFIGGASHTVQDAYTHVLRDEQMRVVAVANFADALSGDYVELRDGPAHSDRLDKCDTRNEFDRMRITAARKATHDLIRGLSTGQDFDATLDEVYELRDGCSSANDYCQSPWLPIAKEGLTEPYKIRPCAFSGVESPPDRSLYVGVLLFLLVLSRRGALTLEQTPTPIRCTE